MRNYFFLFLFLLSKVIHAKADSAITIVDTLSINPPKFYFKGKEGFEHYLASYIRFHPIAIENELEESIQLKIKILENGNLSIIDIIGKEKLFVNELKRVVLLSPKWQPASFNNLYYDTILSYKVNFRIELFRKSKSQKTIPEPKKNNEIDIVYFIKSLTDQAEDEEFKKYTSAKEFYLNGTDEFKKGNYPEAIKLFNQAEELGYNASVLYHDRGVTWYKSGRKNAACKDWMEALRKGFSNTEELINKYCQE